jgi:hypothetical protein
MSPTLLLGFTALAIGLGWLEWKRPAPRLKRTRATLVVVAISALGVLLFRPGIPCAGGGSAAVLLTAGADRALVSRTLDSVGAGVPVFALTEPGLPSPYGSATPVVSVSAIRAAVPGLERLAVVGWGLDDADLESLTGVAVVPVAAGLPGPVQRFGAPARATLGVPLPVTIGLDPAPARRRLELEDGAGRRDTVMVPGGERVAGFTLSPRTAGRETYRILLDGVPAESLALAVAPRPGPVVLVLAGAPSFELAAFRRWLAAQGLRVIDRTMVSRDRYKLDFVNDARASIPTLTPALLDSFDLVVAETRALSHLGGAEVQALTRSVEQGLGLVVLPDGATGDSRWMGGIRLAPDGTSEGVPVRLALASEPAGPRSPASRVAVDVVPVTIMPRFAQRALLRDAAGAVRAAWRPVGAGRVAVSLVATPSRWQRGGEPEWWDRYWTVLVGAVSRSRGTRWSLDPAGPAAVDRRTVVRLEGGEATGTVLVASPSGGRDSLVPVPDPADPTVRSAAWWPVEPGWTRLILGADTLEVLVRGRGDWLPGLAASRLEATGRYASQSASEAGQARDAGAPCRRPVPLLPLVLAFLVATTALWAESRGIFWARVA